MTRPAVLSDNVPDSIQYTVYSIQYTVYRIKYTVYSITEQGEVWRIQLTLNIVQCVQYAVQFVYCFYLCAPIALRPVVLLVGLGADCRCAVTETLLCAVLGR